MRIEQNRMRCLNKPSLKESVTGDVGQEEEALGIECRKLVEMDQNEREKVGKIKK